MNINENLLYSENSDAPIENNRKKSGIFKALVIIFCVLIFGTGILHFLVKDRDFSESENRVLASFPKLTISALADASFMKNFETYMSDQFVFRDTIISMKTFFDRISGITEQNGVYIGKDGYLIEKQTPYSKKKVQSLTESINSFMKKHENISKMVAISPNASYIYADKLPENAKEKNQFTQLKAIYKQLNGENYIFLNITKAFLAVKEKTQLYYHTDHHWTTRGAYEVFKVLAAKWNLNTEKVKYQFYTVSTDFEGTLASKTGIHSVKDTVEICVPKKSAGSYVVNYESQEKKTATLFENSKLNQKNKYELFLGGNYDKVIIDTTSTSRNTLLIIKDSYANCLIPMLTPYFARIVIVDPRYMTDTVESVMEETTFSHVLFLYNLNTFLEDSSLVDALG